MSIKQGAVKSSELHSVKGKFSLAGKKAIVTGGARGFFLAVLVTCLIGLPPWSSPAGEPKKGRVCALLNILCAVTYLVMYWIPAPSAGFWILSLLAALLFGAYTGVHYGTMGDAIDYGELISGVRCDGFLASFTSLAMKCGGAVGPAAGGALLAALNYVANTQQTPQVLNAINLTISVIPCAI